MYIHNFPVQSNVHQCTYVIYLHFPLDAVLMIHKDANEFIRDDILCVFTIKSICENMMTNICKFSNKRNYAKNRLHDRDWDLYYNVAITL